MKTLISSTCGSCSKSPKMRTCMLISFQLRKDGRDVVQKSTVNHVHFVNKEYRYLFQGFHLVFCKIKEACVVDSSSAVDGHARVSRVSVNIYYGPRSQLERDCELDAGVSGACVAPVLQGFWEEVPPGPVIKKWRPCCLKAWMFCVTTVYACYWSLWEQISVPVFGSTVHMVSAFGSSTWFPLSYLSFLSLFHYPNNSIVLRHWLYQFM